MRVSKIHRMLKLGREFRHSVSGVGAIEFAFVFPILIVLYICAFEVTVAYSLYKRTSDATGTIADLVAQQSSVNKEFLATTVSAARSIYAPYATKGMTVKISGLKADASGVARVQWSWDDKNGTPYAKNSVVTLASNTFEPDRFFVRAEVALPHAILRFMYTIDSAVTPFTLRKDYIYDKRQDEPIKCTDC